MVLKLISFGSLFFCLAACNSTPTGANKVVKESINGQKIYEANCAACHLATGEGGISGAKDLRVTKLNTSQIQNRIQNGKNGMMPFGDMLTKEEITAVTAYVQTLSQN